MEKKRLLLPLAVLITIGLMTISCTKDNNGNDPEGTRVLYLRHDEGGVDLFSYFNQISNNIGYYGVSLLESNNFVCDGINDGVNGYDFVKIATVGEVSGLAGVRKIPTSGWSRIIEAIPGTGYVVQNMVRFDEEGFHIEPQNEYARIYVVDNIVNTSGEIEGVKIKYQSPWIP